LLERKLGEKKSKIDSSLDTVLSGCSQQL